MSGLISLTEARQHILQACETLSAEQCAVTEALGRTLAQDIVATHDQPAADMSAMDGYAVRLEDCAVGQALDVIGEAKAGDPFQGTIDVGQAVRISTGAYVPEGADHILIQEESERKGDKLTPTVQQSANGFIRAKGRDFASGDTLLSARKTLAPASIALCAAAGLAQLSVICKPRVAVLTNGNELCDPGEPLSPGMLYDSNGPALVAQITSWGASPGWQGRGGDDLRAMKACLEQALGHDLLIIAGGASVGPHDIVRDAFAELGGELIFSRIALKPGKPAWCGRLGSMLVIGLPGNPASAFVTAELLVKPAILAMSGQRVGAEIPLQTARITDALPANGPRESFLRARVSDDGAGEILITPLGDQDSSLLRPLAESDALLRRAQHDEACEAGATVAYMPSR
ncbi:molybdopterin molybdotransferase MoeA [Alterisphingorhabdus coralli]|uniref:Molybdopterin molybdenumtransferase n=1 Tax=Alterisphingorhabdus coralli TaxID=3071408 RepID=A0AA97I234_9SPHN|nr:gephyrin-like molybdotransferase Glp [Parasphingorhabdus sp. SCSIO 66989]WOE75858.1 molybdopterin molybdotransferase MoeA [Parasphingorhabdus sp. SCSIO 66989]